VLKFNLTDERKNSFFYFSGAKAFFTLRMSQCPFKFLDSMFMSISSTMSVSLLCPCPCLCPGPYPCPYPCPCPCPWHVCVQVHVAAQVHVCVRDIYVSMPHLCTYLNLCLCVYVHVCVCVHQAPVNFTLRKVMGFSHFSM
jgi:hypothetical protein